MNSTGKTVGSISIAGYILACGQPQQECADGRILLPCSEKRVGKETGGYHERNFRIEI